MYIIVCASLPKTTKNTKTGCAPKIENRKTESAHAHFLFSLSKTEFRNRHPSRGPPPAKPPMVVVGDAHPNTMENQGLNNTSSAWLSITAKTRNPGCSRKSQNARSRSDIVFCVFTLMQCCAHSKTTNRLKQLYPHEGEVSPQIEVFRGKHEMRCRAVTSCFGISHLMQLLEIDDLARCTSR